MHLQCLPIKNYRCAGYVDDPLPNIVYLAIWMPACIVWLYYQGRSHRSPGYLNDYRFKIGGACSPRWHIESYLTSTVPGYSDHTTIEIAVHLDFNFTFRMNQKRSQKV